MNLVLLINPADPLPIYRQIMRQISDAIAGAKLRSGDQLPSHRELSEKLVIAPLTVKKAYDELEALGYIESQRGRGTFVSARIPRIAAAAQTAGLKTSARALLSQAYLAGIRFPDVVKLLKDADRELTEGSSHQSTPKPRKA
ncbi:MAG: GntR family transcriptional regulator [Gemmatimonadaceae bacterium]